MKKPGKTFLMTVPAALLSGFLLLPTQSSGQNELLPPPGAVPAPVAAPKAAADANGAAEMGALVNEVVQQQALILNNQKLIDEKLAIIAENLRIARIYVSRNR